MKISLSLLFAVALWSAGILWGLRALVRYANSPGGSGQISLKWPEDSPIRLGELQQSTLVIFLHPKCPCSEASVAQLDRLMARVRGNVAVHAVFVQPAGFRDSEVKGRLWQNASRIPGVRTHVDVRGEEARRFGARVSGHTFAFGPGGQLGYSGGITPSRGHQGDNAGSRAVAAFIDDGVPSPEGGLVFGCQLDHAHPEALNRAAEQLPAATRAR